MVIPCICLLLFGAAVCDNVPSLTGKRSDILQDDAGHNGDIPGNREDFSQEIPSTVGQIAQSPGEIVREVRPRNYEYGYSREADVALPTKPQQRHLMSKVPVSANRNFGIGTYNPRGQLYDGQDIPNPNFNPYFSYPPHLDYSYNQLSPYGRYPLYGVPPYGYPNFYPNWYYPYLGPPAYYGSYGRNAYQPGIYNRPIYQGDRVLPYQGRMDYLPYSGYMPPQGQSVQYNSDRNHLGWSHERDNSVPVYSMNRGGEGSMRPRGQMADYNNVPRYPGGDDTYGGQGINQPYGYQPLQPPFGRKVDSTYNPPLPNTPLSFAGDNDRGFQQVQPRGPTTGEATDNRYPTDGRTLQPTNIDLGSLYRQAGGNDGQNSPGNDGGFPMRIQGRPDVPNAVSPRRPMNVGMTANGEPLNINDGIPLTAEQIEQVFGQNAGGTPAGSRSDQSLTGEGKTSAEGNRNQRERLPQIGPYSRSDGRVIAPTGSRSQAQGQPNLDLNGKIVPQELLDEVSRITAGIPVTKAG